MISSYELPLWLHITFVAIWLGGGLTLQILLFRARKSDDPTAVATTGQEVGWVGEHILTPASIVVLLTGFWLVHEGHWSLGSLWVVLGLIGFFFTMLTGMLFLGPTSKKVGELAAEKGPQDPEVVALSDRLLLVARFDVLVLYAVLFVMVVKPGA